MKLLLMIMAIFEGLTGIALLIVPATTLSLLLGAEITEPVALAIGRVAGAAIGGLAIACWLARDGERGGAATGVVTALLFYNFAADIILIYAGTGLGLQSSLLWPAIVIHVVLGVWCLLLLWRTQKKLAKDELAEATRD